MSFITFRASLTISEARSSSFSLGMVVWESSYKLGRTYIRLGAWRQHLSPLSSTGLDRPSRALISQDDVQDSLLEELRELLDSALVGKNVVSFLEPPPISASSDWSTRSSLSSERCDQTTVKQLTRFLLVQMPDCGCPQQTCKVSPGRLVTLITIDEDEDGCTWLICSGIYENAAAKDCVLWQIVH
ncbi:hypothetical protein AOLI_G00106280 [Acnodon oligacanthus]